MDANHVNVPFMQVYVMLPKALPARARAYKKSLHLTCSPLIGINGWSGQLNRHAVSHDMACLYSLDKLQLMRQTGR